MIIGSLALILVAVVLLVLGLTSGSSTLLISSIAASLLAAVALVVGARQAASARAAGGPHRVPRARDARRADDPTRRRAATTRVTPEEHTEEAAWAGAAEPGSVVHDTADAPATTVPAADRPADVVQPAGDGPRRYDPDVSAAPASGAADSEPDPPDEPAAQVVTPPEAARVAGLDTDVQVIDGRPRYHLAGCVHLLGRSSEALPVREAVELGFTPCGLCEPDSRLLADAHR